MSDPPMKLDFQRLQNNLTCLLNLSPAERGPSCTQYLPTDAHYVDFTCRDHVSGPHEA